MTIKNKYDIGQTLFIARYFSGVTLCDECTGTGTITILDGNKHEVTLTCGKCGGKKKITKHILVPVKAYVKEISIFDSYRKNGHISYRGYADISYGLVFHLGEVYFHREDYVATDEMDMIRYCDRHNGFSTLDFINSLQRTAT